MEPSHDKILQLEEESLQDDSTSCTSSLATSLSEEQDDLYLGAEANSFDLDFTRRDDAQREGFSFCKTRKSPFHALLLSKGNESFDSEGTGQTISTFSSVSELIAARECDAQGILVNLGFATSEDDNRKDILARFSSQSHYRSNDGLEHDEDSRRSPETVQIVPQPADVLHESIHKTEEWLAHRHQQQISDEANGDAAKQSKTTTDSANSKRAGLARVAKLRRKFSRSRPPSFELLLPNLQEEDLAADSSENVERAKKSDDSDFTPIRENSLEERMSRSAYDGEAEPASCPARRPYSLKELTPPKHASLCSAQVESFELEEINSNEDPLDIHKLRQMSPVRVNYPRRVGVVQMPRELAPSSPCTDPGRSETPSESDENETSSGFDESDNDHAHDKCNHAAHAHEKCGCENAVRAAPRNAGCEICGYESSSCEQCGNGVRTTQGNGNREVLPTAIVQTLKKTCCHHLDTHRSPPAITSKYVYDVTMGAVGDVTPTSSRNCNNNNNGFVASNSHVHITDDLTLHCSTRAPSSGTRCVLVPRSRSADDVVWRHSISDARRRRREFAAHSALSGDSFAELSRALPPSSLLRHNGDYFFRKRRPGACHITEPIAASGSVCNGHGRATVNGRVPSPLTHSPLPQKVPVATSRLQPNFASHRADLATETSTRGKERTVGCGVSRS